MSVAKLVYSTKQNSIFVPEEMGTPKDDQLQGGVLDQLAELSGRVCYDSLGKGRSSEEYHKHIREVGHLSVYEHCPVVFNFYMPADMWQWLSIIFMNRPSLHTRVKVIHGTKDGEIIYVTVVANIRHLLEWDNMRYLIGFPRHPSFNFDELNRCIGTVMCKLASKVAPLSIGEIHEEDYNLAWYVLSKLNIQFKNNVITYPEPGYYTTEHWASFYIGGVSRGFTHELVRHGDWTAISQRSTRYVDESESKWMWHPLYKQFLKNKHPLMHNPWKPLEDLAKKVYKDDVDVLQKFLIERGTSKSTARKQARGAARGGLGNALSTELIFSASLPQWRHLLEMRLNPAADGEMRVVMPDVFRTLADEFPSVFEDYTLVEAPDGIGYALQKIKI